MRMKDRENSWECVRREKLVLLKETNIFLGKKDREDGREEKSIESACQTETGRCVWYKVDMRYVRMRVCNNDVEMCKDDKL